MLENTARVALSLFSLLFVVGCSVHNTTPHDTEKGQVNGPRTHMHTVPPDADAYEKDFLHRMSDHHASAIAMSTLAEQKASHADLRAMANALSKEQQREVDLMRGWLSKWYGRDLAPHVTDDMKPVLDRLSTLPPEQFDRAFLEEMIKHHQAGIVMAQPMTDQAPHVEVRTLAKTIITEQSKESAELSKRLRQWYGVTAPTAKG